MPLLRRRSDPRELTEVLRRLERLRMPSSSTPSPISGWLPHNADSRPDEQPTADEQPAEADAPPSLSARLSGVRLHAFDPGRRGVAVLVVVAALGAGGGGWYFVHAAPRSARDEPSAVDATSPAASSSTPLPSAPAAWPTAAGTSSAASSSSADSSLVVDVVGKVVHAGVFTLPAGARVVDAIAAAGGALPNTDLTGLDLAGRLLDGAEVFVGIPPPSGAAAQAAGGVIGGAVGGPGEGASNSGGAASPAVVNLNTATQAELETLPGVGAVTAERILAWRAQHQRFTSVVQLQQVSGIGPAKYAALVGHVTV
jgi:competence protein ComEA